MLKLTSPSARAKYLSLTISATSSSRLSHLPRSRGALRPPSSSTTLLSPSLFFASTKAIKCVSTSMSWPSGMADCPIPMAAVCAASKNVAWSSSLALATAFRQTDLSPHSRSSPSLSFLNLTSAESSSKLPSGKFKSACRSPMLPQALEIFG